MDDSSCDVPSSSAVTTVSAADTQCAFRRISHGHVADLLFPDVEKVKLSEADKWRVVWPGERVLDTPPPC
jgi:hypothetical protein